MKPILVIEQDELLPGVGVLGERLRVLGAPHRRLRTWEEELTGLRARDFAGIVPLGGSMHAWEEEKHPFLRDERRLLGEAVEEGVPVLGVCLGAQLLARALGAEVRAGRGPEIGWLDVAPTAAAAADPILRHLNRPASVYQWHLDEFALPPLAARLASSELFPNQAFRVGEAWGVQFHPEVDLGLFELWIENHPGAAASYGIDEDDLREAVRRGSADETSHAFRAGLFDAFVQYAAE